MDKKDVLILRNYYEIMKMPKTTARVFKELHVGEIICVELGLENRKGYSGRALAMYPKVNGETISGIDTINNLISNGMVLRELDAGEVAKLIEDSRRKY